MWSQMVLVSLQVLKTDSKDDLRHPVNLVQTVHYAFSCLAWSVLVDQPACHYSQPHHLHRRCRPDASQQPYCSLTAALQTNIFSSR